MVRRPDISISCYFMLKNSVYFDKNKNTYLHAAYADDSTFFLKNLNSPKKLLNTIKIFSSFTGLKPNLSKCENSLIGALKEITVAVCGIKCIGLTKECLKIPVFKGRYWRCGDWEI